jgi:hypothetical protein
MFGDFGMKYRGSFEVLIQCNRIESRVITGEALPSPLQLGPAILWFKILSN